jgi:hypothetical protein
LMNVYSEIQPHDVQRNEIIEGKREVKKEKEEKEGEKEEKGEVDDKVEIIKEEE